MEKLCIYCEELDYFTKNCHKKPREPGIYQAARIVKMTEERGKYELNLLVAVYSKGGRSDLLHLVPEFIDRVFHAFRIHILKRRK